MHTIKMIIILSKSIIHAVKTYNVDIIINFVGIEVVGILLDQLK